MSKICDERGRCIHVPYCFYASKCLEPEVKKKFWTKPIITEKPIVVKNQKLWWHTTYLFVFKNILSQIKGASNDYQRNK